MRDFQVGSPFQVQEAQGNSRLDSNPNPGCPSPPSVRVLGLFSVDTRQRLCARVFYLQRRRGTAGETALVAGDTLLILENGSAKTTQAESRTTSTHQKVTKDKERWGRYSAKRCRGPNSVAAARNRFKLPVVFRLSPSLVLLA